MEELNYALVEDVRPPIYTAMKYWGKKPHNIWRTYIENYTPENGLYLDPFAGSAISIFEAIKAKRKAIAFDLNPLTSFIIEVFSTPFDKKQFEIEANKIFAEIEQDEVYKKYFFTQSRNNESLEEIVCFKWDSGQLYEIGIEENKESKKKKARRYVAKPNEKDIEKGHSMHDIEISCWFPNDAFPQSPSFSANFLQCIGGNNFSKLWTRRNLYVLSKIFDKILNCPDKNLKRQLLFGFIQTLHLCTKMSVPRREAANRDFSTSWGRSAYICSARQMEMNALLVFKGSCFGKQSVESCLSSVVGYLGRLPKITSVSYSNKQKNKLSGFDIKYGVIDINTILEYVPENSIDFIMTDPPYGGLVQYLDLSLIWLNWLVHYDPKYKPNLEAEITIKKGQVSVKDYTQRFKGALQKLYKILKSDGKIVFTFHNKELSIWNAFLKSIASAGFKIEKVIHQQNRRTGEANVANPYGTSGTDFYIRCVKSEIIEIKSDKDEFEYFVLTKATEIIASRNEPTPYQFLFNGILAEISSAGFDLEDFDSNIQQILEKQVGERFQIIPNEDNKAGNYWWFIRPEDHIIHPDRPLTDRVEESIVSLLRRRTTVSLDDVLGYIFQRYPNGLTPDIKSIDKVLKKYATRSNGKWLYKHLEMEVEYTRHTEMLYYLSDIGHKAGYRIFIGKREQSEKYGDHKLSEFADVQDLGFLFPERDKVSRVEMIDMLWLKDNKIELIIEVENTTKFTSGIQRASNVETGIPKLMIIPDERKDEFLRVTDRLFTDNFKKYNWKYIFYSEIEKIKASRSIHLSLVDTFAKELE